MRILRIDRWVNIASPTGMDSSPAPVSRYVSRCISRFSAAEGSSAAGPWSWFWVIAGLSKTAASRDRGNTKRERKRFERAEASAGNTKRERGKHQARAEARARVFGPRREGAWNERLSDEGENTGFERAEASAGNTALGDRRTAG